MQHSARRLFCLGLLAVSILSESCRKGDEDPFLTMRGRKARLEGSWQLAALDESGTWRQGGTSGGFATRLEGENLRLDPPSPGEGTVVQVEEYSLTVNRDGSFEQVISYSEVMPDSSRITLRLDLAGSWEFLGRSDDYRKRERVVFFINEEIHTTGRVGRGGQPLGMPEVTTNTFEDGERTRLWVLVRLANKELKVESEIEDAWEMGGPNPLQFEPNLSVVGESKSEWKQ